MSKQRISLQTNLTFSVNSRACDQCNNRRVKCNKRLPICMQCEDKGLACTWVRELSHKPGLPYQNLETFSIGKRQRKSKKEKESPIEGTGDEEESTRFNNVINVQSFTSRFHIKPQKVGPNPTRVKNKVKKESSGEWEDHDPKKHFQLIFKVTNSHYNGVQAPHNFQLKRSVFPSNWILAFKKWFNSSSARCEFFYFLAMSGYTLTSITIKDQALLSDVFHNKLQLMKVKINNHSILNEVFLNLDPIVTVINQCVEAFFHYSNIFLPLFTYQSFKARPRSYRLKLCVYLAGLQFINPPHHIKSILLDYLHSKLEIMMQPSLIQPSLDMLQCFLIIFIAIRSSDILLKRMWIFQSAAYSMKHNLGLLYVQKMQTPNEKFDEESILEHKLAYRVLLSLDVSGIWSMGLLPKDPFSFNKHYPINKSTMGRYFKLLVGDNQPSLQHPKVKLTSNIPGGFKGDLGCNQNSQEDDKHWKLMDLCLLLISECISHRSILLKQIYSAHYQSLNDQLSQRQYKLMIRSALSKLNQSFYQGTNKIISIRSQLQNLGKNTIDLRGIDQSLVFLYVQYQFTKLLILKLTTFIDPSSDRILIRPNHALRSFGIDQGLTSALKVIQLISRTGTQPFLMMRLSFLAVSTHFIITHYQTYQSTELHAQMLKGLLLARSIFLQITLCKVGSHQANSNLSVLNSLMQFHNIQLPD